jgi:hypothetical protein
VAILVAVLGNTSDGGHAALGAFRHGWWVIAAVSFASIVPALALLSTRHQASQATDGAGPSPTRS